MNAVTIYLLEVLIASGLFALGFAILKKYSSLEFRRIYLLLWLVLSGALPLLDIQTSNARYSISSRIELDEDQVAVNSSDTHTETTNERPKEVVAESDGRISWSLIDSIVVLYCLVSFGLFMRMLWQIWSVTRFSKNGSRKELNKEYFLEIDSPQLTGASFFKWIFIGSSLSESEQELVLKHESAHRRLWHSVDILLSQLYVAMFWWNPMGWFLRDCIRLNTEMEADEQALKSTNKVAYANLLLRLVAERKVVGALSQFSMFHVKHRIHSLNSSLSTKKWAYMIALTVIAGSFVLVSCSDLESSGNIVESDKMYEDIKTITTRFESHQSDTQQKDNQVVAVAYFLPDGSLDKVDQHMTYPYDFEQSYERSFWTNPKKTNLGHLMDGLDLGHAEKNLLYGNDWPIVFEKISKEEYPGFSFLESESYTTSTTWDETLPLEIELTMDREHDYVLSGTFFERFTYTDGKVTNHTSSQKVSSHYRQFHEEAIDRAKKDGEKNFVKMLEDKLESFLKTD